MSEVNPQAGSGGTPTNQESTPDLSKLTTEQILSLAPEDVRTEDFKGIWQNAPKDLPNLLKSYAHAQKLSGGQTKIPTEKSTPEEVRAFWGKVGVPETIDGYGQIDRPEWMPEQMFSEGFVKGFLETAHKHNVPASAVKALVSFYQDQAKASIESASKFSEQAVTELRNAWGGAAERNAQMAHRAAFFLAGDEGKRLFDDPVYGDNPTLVKMFHKISQVLVESGHLDANVENVPSVADARTEANRIISDKNHPLNAAYQDALHPDHERAVKEVEKLFQLATL